MTLTTILSLALVRNFFRWLGRQADGILRGLMGLASTSPADWMPNGIWSTIVEIVKSATWAFGTSSPTKQVTASVTLAIFAILTSFITLGATLWLVGLFAGTALIGIARLSPAVNQWWVATRETLIPKA